MTGLLAAEPRPVDVPALAAEALWQELELTPKPGLVDRLNNGSHRDMDHALFVRSIMAITPWFARFAELGEAHAAKPADRQLRILRPMGMACEQAMYAATGGVNTHKGGIFALGLLCFAAGRVKNISADSLCCEVSNICRGLVARELAGRKALDAWNGQSLHGLLLRLMAVNQDSNLVSRGGIEGLRYVQGYARELLANGWDCKALLKMDKALIERNLSPGGSADLLSVGWVLSGIK